MLGLQVNMLLSTALTRKAELVRCTDEAALSDQLGTVPRERWCDVPTLIQPSAHLAAQAMASLPNREIDTLATKKKGD